tara:strand:+ start:15369 stop:16592 length:1224 start_codon:yes stop_codon:yes gene_type:complete
MLIKKCRSCKSNKLVETFSLGYQKLTGVFPKSKKEIIPGGDLSLVLCKNCTLLQLKQSFDSNEMYGENYGYMSSLNSSMVQHLKKKSLELSNFLKLKKNDIILDIGSNDGTFLSFFSKNKKLIGIDPTIIKFKNKYRKDIIQISDFFSYEKIKKILNKKKIRLITTISMFYDLEDPVLFAKDVERLLEKNGVWHLEQSYMPTMLKNNSFDTICHEHLEYYSLKSIKFILNKAKLRIIDIQLNLVNGGSFSLTVCKKNSKFKTNHSVIEWMEKEEKKMKLQNKEIYENFFKSIKNQKNTLKNLLIKLKKEKKKVVGYGASTKGNVILQYGKINSKILPYIAEVNKFKFNKFTPGTKIKIIPESKLRKIDPDYILVLPWHFKDFIMKKERKFLAKRKKIIFPLPVVEIC